MTATASPAARQALKGRREDELLDLPSVAHLADVLAERCAASWVRLAVTTLDRFRSAQVDHPDRLEQLLTAARADHSVATKALAAFAGRRDHDSPSQVEALSFGPKLWFALSGVPIAWRPVRPHDRTPSGPHLAAGPGDLRLMLMAMIGSGLSPEELLQVRLSDVGALTVNGEVTADVLASPLAIRCPSSQESAARLTFLPFHACAELTTSLARRAAAGERLDGDAPLISDAPVDDDGTPVADAARRYHRRLIEAGNEVNVATCRTTGDFFRAWGLPGARFVDTTPAEATS